MLLDILAKQNCQLPSLILGIWTNILFYFFHHIDGSGSGQVLALKSDKNRPPVLHYEQERKGFYALRLDDDTPIKIKSVPSFGPRATLAFPPKSTLDLDFQTLPSNIELVQDPCKILLARFSKRSAPAILPLGIIIRLPTQTSAAHAHGLELIPTQTAELLSGFSSTNGEAGESSPFLTNEELEALEDIGVALDQGSTAAVAVAVIDSCASPAKQLRLETVSPGSHGLEVMDLSLNWGKQKYAVATVIF